MWKENVLILGAIKSFSEGTVTSETGF